MANKGVRQDSQVTKDTPYPILMVELWGVHCEYFKENPTWYRECTIKQTKQSPTILCVYYMVRTVCSNSTRHLPSYKAEDDTIAWPWDRLSTGLVKVYVYAIQTHTFFLSHVKYLWRGHKSVFNPIVSNVVNFLFYGKIYCPLFYYW